MLRGAVDSDDDRAALDAEADGMVPEGYRYRSELEVEPADGADL